MKKYRLTGTKQVVRMSTGEKVTVEQIEALIDLPRIHVAKGDLGGWVFNEDCLSQEGSCWVRDYSFVTEGARVEGDAQIINNSQIESQSVIRHQAMIDESIIRGQSIVDNEVTVRSSVLSKNCSIGERVVIQDTRIENVMMHKGRIIDSIVASTESRLHFKGETTILASRVRVEDVEAVVREACHIEEVTGGVFTGFQLYEETKLVRVTFTGKNSLRTGNRNVNGLFDKTVIEGEKGSFCAIEDSILALTDTTIRGSVSLQGWIQLTNCNLSELAHVHSISLMLLTLEDVTMAEMATIKKTSLRQASEVTQVFIGMDNVLTV